MLLKYKVVAAATAPQLPCQQVVKFLAAAFGSHVNACMRCSAATHLPARKEPRQHLLSGVLPTFPDACLRTHYHIGLMTCASMP